MNRLEASARAVLGVDGGGEVKWVRVEEGDEEVRAICERCGGWIWLNRRCKVDVGAHLSAFMARHRTCRG